MTMKSSVLRPYRNGRRVNFDRWKSSGSHWGANRGRGRLVRPSVRSRVERQRTYGRGRVSHLAHLVPLCPLGHYLRRNGDVDRQVPFLQLDMSNAPALHQFVHCHAPPAVPPSDGTSHLTAVAVRYGRLRKWRVAVCVRLRLRALVLKAGRQDLTRLELSHGHGVVRVEVGLGNKEVVVRKGRSVKLVGVSVAVRGGCQVVVDWVVRCLAGDAKRREKEEVPSGKRVQDSRD